MRAADSLGSVLAMTMVASILLAVLAAAVPRAQSPAPPQTPAAEAARLVRRAKLELASYHLAKSIQLLEEALRIAADPPDREAQLMLARIYGHVERYPDGIALCRKLLAKDPSDAEAICRIGEIMALAGEPQRALETIAPLLAQQPPPVRALDVQGDALFQLDKADAARAALNRALEIDPDDHVACFLIGRHALGARRLPEAITFLLRCLRIQNQKGKDALIGVPACELLGDAFLDSGNYGGATNFLEQYAQFDPDRPGLHHRLGLAHSMMNHHEQAQEHLRKAIAEDPRDVVARARLASVLTAQGRIEEAIEQLKAAAAADPGYAFAPSQLGVLYVKLGRKDEARAAFAKAVELAPDFTDATFAYGQFLLGEQETEAAIRWLDATIAREPLHVQAYYLLAQALRRSGKPEDRARADAMSAVFEKLQPHQRDIDRARSVLNTSPVSAESHLELGARLADIGCGEAALVHLDQAVAANPALLDARKQRAAVNTALGRGDRARADLEIAAKLAPEDADVKAALEKLR